LRFHDAVGQRLDDEIGRHRVQRVRGAGARVAELLWQTAQVCWNTASCALCGDGVNCTDAGPDADIMIAPARMRMHRNRASLRDIIG
jgi:hypothetical protein